MFFSLFLQGSPPTDAPVVDTAEQVYISSLALLKVDCVESYMSINLFIFFVNVNFFKIPKILVR